MNRKWRVLVAGLTPLLALSLLPSMSSTAAVTPAFDAYIASGDASCVEFTITVGGYSFIVQPDIRLPRATAKVSEGASGALAAPVDPGDSADALAGLMVPREEETVPNQIESSIPLPWPANTNQELATVENPINPTLEYPYEHASASYPNAASPGDQHATYLSALNATATDPTGAFSILGSTGDATAGPGIATASAGAGTSRTLPTLGVSLGSVSAQSTAQTTATAVTNDVSCSLQDLTVTPPQGGMSLHIGSLHASLHTERSLAASRATATHSIQLGDVTLNGNNLIAAGGGSIVIPAGVPATQTFPAIPPVCPPAQTQQPCVQAPSLQSMSITGTSNRDAVSSSGNEDSSSLTAATVTLQTTALVPGSIPPSPNGSPVPASTPVTYTMQLANLDSSAYGFTPPPVSPSPSPHAIGGKGSPGAGGRVVVNPGTSGTSGTAGTQPAAASIAVPGVPGGIRWPVVGLAAAMESLLLGWLFMRRRSMHARPGPPQASSLIDLP